MASSPLIDNVKQYETPLGVELTLYPAGLPVRTAAFTIDFVIKLAIIIFFGVLLSLLGDFGVGLFLVSFFVVDWFYFVFWDVVNNGQPPGKFILGIRTVHADGTPITLAGSVVRTLLLTADFLPLFYIAGILCIASHKHFRRLGDLAAGTMVVYDNPILKHTAHRVNHTRKLAMMIPPDERLNFLAFQNRYAVFSDPRRIELSEKLTPLIKLRGQPAVDEVLGIAEGLRRSS